MLVKLARMIVLLLVLAALGKALDMPIGTHYDDSLQVYNQYFKLLNFVGISRIHCLSENNEQYDAIESFSGSFVKQFSEIRKYVKKFSVHCQCGPSNLQNGPIIVDDVSPKLRTRGDIIASLSEVSYYNLGTVIISWGPNVLCDSFIKEARGYKRSLYLLIFIQKDISEQSIWYLLNRCWKNMNILNIVIHTPLSKEKNYIYIYDPFYIR